MLVFPLRLLCLKIAQKSLSKTANCGSVKPLIYIARKIFMNSKIVIVFGFILALSGCDKAAEKEIGYGVIENGSYKNSYFGMEIEVPQGWSVQSQAQLDAISGAGAELIAGDDANLKGAMEASQKQSVNLFAFFKYEQGAPVDFNPSLMAVAERVSGMPGIKRGSDYLFHSKKLLQSGQLTIDFPRENFTTELSGISFDVMPLTMEFNGVLVYQEYYASRFKDYVLAFVVTYSNESELTELNGYLKMLRFTE